jgi:hypothetical protein
MGRFSPAGGGHMGRERGNSTLAILSSSASVAIRRHFQHLFIVRVTRHGVTSDRPVDRIGTTSSGGVEGTAGQ